jgi:hypothetical protein
LNLHPLASWIGSFVQSFQMSVACPECGSPAILTLTHYLTGERSGEEDYDLRCSAAQHELDERALRALWEGTGPDLRTDAGPRTA